MAKVQRSIRISPEVDAALSDLAQREQRSRSQLIEMALFKTYLAPPQRDASSLPQSSVHRASPSPSLQRFKG